MSNSSHFSFEKPEGQPIGYVVGGGLKANLFVRLTVPADQVQEGGFVVLESGNWQFYGLVTDLQLGAADPRYAEKPIDNRLSPVISRLLNEQTLYTNLEVLPALMLERGPELDSPDYEAWAKAHQNENVPHPLPIKTVPSHHALARLASAGDVAEIFGEPGQKGFFEIGKTREQDHPVCINLDKFVQRSAGIFGATGSGKSFLTRIILAGLIEHNAASVLVFDMHNEYGFDDIASDTGQPVVGLRSKFASRVRVVGLGRKSTIRGKTPDLTLEINESDIQPEDVELLARELNLRDTTSTTLDALIHSFGAAKWFNEFKKMVVGAMETDGDGKKVPAPDSVAFWANQVGINVAAAEGLRSKLTRVFNRPYIVDSSAGADPLKNVIEALQAGQHVILSFGDYESDLDYLLVSNLLTRKIRDAWEESTNEFRSHGKTEPRPLVIAVEEAHKLLNREMASQTSFSTIAREMRKYYVTLLIIDQRPSQIYDEVMSQLGTRVSGWLGDESDVAAVLSGLAGRDALRGMLARLQPKEEVVLLGWGVPMPILVRSRRYDQKFWDELLPKSGARSVDQNLKDLGF